MKKVLFATTALVATAGVASAQGVAVTGSAEMGIFGGSGVETQFFQDIDVTFTMSGETDNGLSFGAAVDLDESWQGDSAAATINEVVLGADVNGDGDSTDTAVVVGSVNGALANNSDDGGVAIFLSGNFGTITMGDTDGALDWALTEAGNVGNPGSIADDETSHAGYLGSYGDGGYDGQIVRYDHSIGDFGFAISTEMDDTGTRDAGYAVGLRYGAMLGGADLSLGLGYQSSSFAAGDQSIIGVSATVAVSGFQAGIQYSDWSDVGGVAGTDDSHIGVGVGYSQDAFSIHANYGEFDSGNSGWGIAAGYDLGGGAAIRAGYGSSDRATGNTDSFSLGIAMSF